MRLMQRIHQMRRQNPLPKIRGLRSMNFSLRPFRWRMTFYLFLLRPLRLPQVLRLRIKLSAEQWHVSFEHPTQAALLGLKFPRPVKPRVWPRVWRPRAVNVPGEPEIEIIPLAPVWR